MSHPDYGRTQMPSAGRAPSGRGYPAAPPPRSEPRSDADRDDTMLLRIWEPQDYPAEPPPPASPPRRTPPPSEEEPERPGRARTDAKLARLIAAAASLAAGAVHVAATPAHWEEWLLAGVFFAGSAAFQLLWGLLAILFRNAFLQVAGLLANLGFLGVWALSRVNGMPFGPHAGVPEAIGTADLVAAALESVVVVGLLLALLPRERDGVLAPFGYRAVLLLAFVTAAAVAVPGVTDALEHGHSHGSETVEDDGHDHDHGDMDESDEMTDEATEEAADETSADPEEEDHTHAPGEEHD